MRGRGGVTRVFRTTCRQTIDGGWGEGWVWEFKSVLGGSSFFGEFKCPLCPPSLMCIVHPPPSSLCSLLLQSITRSTWPRHQASTGLLLFVVFQLSRPPGLNQYENVLCVRACVSCDYCTAGVKKKIVPIQPRRVSWCENWKVKPLKNL